jgi:pimeloyl-ACP methyl ester carboxylesterase
MWNEMAPAYFSQWDERYRPQVEVDWAAPEPLKEFNGAIPDLREAARGITAPTLVITGRDDFIGGPAAAEAAAEAIPHAEVVLIDGGQALHVPGAARGVSGHRRVGASSPARLRRWPIPARARRAASPRC